MADFGVQRSAPGREYVSKLQFDWSTLIEELDNGTKLGGAPQVGEQRAGVNTSKEAQIVVPGYFYAASKLKGSPDDIHVLDESHEEGDLVMVAKGICRRDGVAPICTSGTLDGSSLEVLDTTGCGASIFSLGQDPYCVTYEATATLDSDSYAMLLRAHEIETRPTRFSEELWGVVQRLNKPSDGVKRATLTFVPTVPKGECMTGLLGELPGAFVHGQLPTDEQTKRLEVAEGENEKKVLTSGIGKTGLTVPGVSTVGSCGLEAQSFFDPNSGMSCVQTVQGRKADRTQEYGRAGRIPHQQEGGEWVKERLLLNYSHPHEELRREPYPERDPRARECSELVRMCGDHQLPMAYLPFEQIPYVDAIRRGCDWYQVFRSGMGGRKEAIAGGMPAELLIAKGREILNRAEIRAEMRLLWLAACISCEFPTSLDVLGSNIESAEEEGTEEPIGALLLDALDDGLDSFTSMFRDPHNLAELGDPRFDKTWNMFDHWVKQLQDAWELQGDEWDHVGDLWEEVLGDGLPFFGGRWTPSTVKEGERYPLELDFRPWLGLGEGGSQCVQSEVNAVGLGGFPVGRRVSQEFTKWVVDKEGNPRWPRLLHQDPQDPELLGIVWPPIFTAKAPSYFVTRKPPRELDISIPPNLPRSGNVKAFVAHFEERPLEIANVAPVKSDLFDLFRTDVRVGLRSAGEESFADSFTRSLSERREQVKAEPTVATSNSPTLSHISSFAVLNMSNAVGVTPRVMSATAGFYGALGEDDKDLTCRVLGADRKELDRTMREVQDWDEDFLLKTGGPDEVPSWGEFFGDDDFVLSPFLDVYRFYRVFLNKEEESAGKCVRVDLGTTEHSEIQVDFTERSLRFKRFPDEEGDDGSRVWKCVDVHQWPKAVTKYRAVQPALAYTFGGEAEQEMAPRLFKTTAWEQGRAKAPGSFGNDGDAASSLLSRFPRFRAFCKAIMDSYDLDLNIGRIVSAGSGKGLGSGKSVATALSTEDCGVRFLMRAMLFFNPVRLGTKVIPSFWEAVERFVSEKDKESFRVLLKNSELFSDDGDPRLLRFKLDDVEKGSKELPPGHCSRGATCTDKACKKIHVFTRCRRGGRCSDSYRCMHLHLVKDLVPKDSLSRSSYDQEMRTRRGLPNFPFSVSLCRAAAGVWSGLERPQCVPIPPEYEPHLRNLLAGADRARPGKGGAGKGQRKGKGKKGEKSRNSGTRQGPKGRGKKGGDVQPTQGSSSSSSSYSRGYESSYSKGYDSTWKYNQGNW
jgi:hypothetical protein